MRLPTVLLFSILSVHISAAVNSSTGLIEAIRSGDSVGLEKLLEAKVDVNDRQGRFTPLALASIKGDLLMVNLLLDNEADPNAPSLNGANALSIAVRSCRAPMELIYRLIDAGADIENRSGVGITPLMFAVQEEQTELALNLIDAGADVNTLNPFGEGVLNYAIYTQNTTLIQKALDAGVKTEQLAKLYTTIDYDPPGIGDAQSHHNVLCQRNH